MAKGAPRKAVQCVWHEEAKSLRAQGWTYHTIAEKFGVTDAAVYFAINPDKRIQYAMKRGAKV
jgi:predicted transcriptional regulator